MLIKNWMNKTVVNVDANDSVLEALKLIKIHKVHLLPVTKDGELVGVITDRDMEKALASHADLGDKRAPSEKKSIIKVREAMTKNPVTVPMDGNVEEVAEILLKHNISSVLVTHHDGEVAGTFSQSDGLNALITVTGIKKKGIQFALQVEDHPGAAKDAEDIIRKYGGRIASVLVSDERVPEGYRRIYIRMVGIDRFKLRRLKEDLGKIGDLLYTVERLDFTEGID